MTIADMVPALKPDYQITIYVADTVAAIVDSYHEDKCAWLHQYRSDHGSVEWRQVIISLAVESEDDYNAMPENVRDVMVWDFEFIPRWLNLYGLLDRRPDKDELLTYLAHEFPGVATALGS